MLSRHLYLVVFSFTFHSYFILSLLGVQTKAATKSKGVQCTLLKDLFVIATPCQSENDGTDLKERKGFAGENATEPRSCTPLVAWSAVALSGL